MRCVSALWPKHRQHRRGDDEEREQRHQREIGEVAGVDEAVVVDADRDALDHLERGAAGLDFGPFRIKSTAGATAMVGPIFGSEAAGERRSCAGSDAHATPAGSLRRRSSSRRTRASSASSAGIVDHQRHQLVAAPAALLVEALALQPQRLARARCPWGRSASPASPRSAPSPAHRSTASASVIGRSSRTSSPSRVKKRCG